MNSPVALVLALLAAPALSPAQTAPASLAAVADPAVTVPVPVYRSALAYGPRGVAPDSVDWLAANAEVARFPRGHTDILKWEQSQSALTPTLPPALSRKERAQGSDHENRPPRPPGEGGSEGKP